MLSCKFNNELFESEINILNLAKVDLENKRYSENELLNKYRTLTEQYEKLLKFTTKSIRISDFQGKELKRREYEIRNILDNSNQGFLTFDRNLVVNKEYSSECLRLFQRKIANESILELLKSENNEQNELFSSVFKDIFSETDKEKRLLYLKKLPNLLKINDNYVNVSYKVINSEEVDEDMEAIMVILTDITEKKKTEDQLMYLSYHDKLTTLFNRAYIDSVIPQLNTESMMPLSVIMADMNCLKLTNDVFGHENGDRLLMSAAKVLMNSCRDTDVVARWGGDEFLIILPNTDSSSCKKICLSIKEMSSKLKPEPIELSFSLGSATTESPNTNIYELFNISEKVMYSNKLLESKNIRKKIILSLEKTLSERCIEEYNHINRAKKMALKFGRALNIKPDSKEMLNLTRLASFHDIGKIVIPKEILEKGESLTESEWDIVKSYTEIGFRIAQSIEEPVLAQSILCLRERWDGKGYPYGLKNENIPLNSRIISIIDSYDVMTHDRSYKKAISHKEALEELKRCSGTQYDPNLVNIFIGKMVFDQTDLID